MKQPLRSFCTTGWVCCEKALIAFLCFQFTMGQLYGCGHRDGSETGAKPIYPDDGAFITTEGRYPPLDSGVVSVVASSTDTLRVVADNELSHPMLVGSCKPSDENSIHALLISTEIRAENTQVGPSRSDLLEMAKIASMLVGVVQLDPEAAADSARNIQRHLNEFSIPLLDRMRESAQPTLHIERVIAMPPGVDDPSNITILQYYDDDGEISERNSDPLQAVFQMHYQAKDESVHTLAVTYSAQNSSWILDSVESVPDFATLSKYMRNQEELNRHIFEIDMAVSGEKKIFVRNGDSFYE